MKLRLPTVAGEVYGAAFVEYVKAVLLEHRLQQATYVRLDQNDRRRLVGQHLLEIVAEQIVVYG